MTEGVKIALIMSVPLNIVGLASLVVSIINGKKTDRNGEKSTKILLQSDGTLTELKSELSNVKAEVANVKEQLSVSHGLNQRLEGRVEGAAAELLKSKEAIK